MKQGMLYKAVLVLGTGKIARGVLEHAARLKASYGYRLLYLNNGDSIYDEAGNYAIASGIDSMNISGNKELTNFFFSLMKKTLVISAGNFYLFPGAVVAKENIVIINYHNAVLPDYPGRNAPSWVIFNDEKATGITWHYVTDGIDKGAVIHREYCAVDEDEKAYHLVEHLMELGITGFQKCFQDILAGTAGSVPQKQTECRKIYNSWEIPGGGQCFSDDKPDYIYRLLRALDYGKANIFPRVTLWHKGIPLKVLRYAKVKSLPEGAERDTIYITLSEGRFLRIRYQKQHTQGSSADE